MPITVQWDNSEKTVIRWIYSQGWTWDDAYQARDEEYRLIESVDYVVDALGDMRLAKSIPVSALSAVKGVLTGRHSRLGLTVLFGGNAFVQVMYDMIKKVYPGNLAKGRIVLTRTEEQAYHLLEKDRIQREIASSTIGYQR